MLNGWRQDNVGSRGMGAIVRVGRRIDLYETVSSV